MRIVRIGRIRVVAIGQTGALGQLGERADVVQRTRIGVRVVVIRAGRAVFGLFALLCVLLR